MAGASWGVIALEGDGDPVRPADTAMRLAQADVPRISVLSTIHAAPASRVRLEIGIQPLDAAPRRSFVRLRGLPALASLSEGHAISPGAWAVPLSGLSDLEMALPADISGQYQITVSLVAEDGAVVAQAASTVIVAAKQAAAADPAARREPAKLAPADREAAERLIARGERDMQDGNVSLARQFFLRAAEAGLARGALLLGATYDQRELARQNVRSVQPNPALARKWYERARELGDTQAEERLTSLGGG